MLAGLWLWFSCAALAQFAAGVDGMAVPDTSVGGALSSMALRADVVFAGRVTAIRRGPVAGGSTGVVCVDFSVEQALEGNVAGTYTLREWGGLWAAGQHRYWVGEHVVLFAHAAGAAGLSSPVDGMEGVLPLVQENAQSEPLLDLRRVAARVVRAKGAPIVDATNNAMSLSELSALVQVAHEPLRPEPVKLPLPVGIVKPPVVQPRVVLPRSVPRPVVPLALHGAVENATRPALEALLRPLDPEREAVGESVWGAQ